MGYADGTAKEYTRQNDIFVFSFNYYLYGGAQTISRSSSANWIQQNCPFFQTQRAAERGTGGLCSGIGMY